MGDGLTFDSGGSAMAAAIQWVAEVLTGSLGTSVCVLAVAAFGSLLFSGKVPARRGMGVIVGCFIILSASRIADGLTAYRQSDIPTDEIGSMPVAPVKALAGAPTAPPPNDPYGFPPANDLSP